ncbi:restriction endonuclease subunit S [Legionella pneumophila]
MSNKYTKQIEPILRFPEFRNSESWEITLLSKFAHVIAGQSPAGINFNDNEKGLPFYQGKTNFGDIYLLKPSTWTTEITKTANPGDILMSVRAPVGALNISTDKVCIGRGVAAIQAKRNKWFLYYFLSSIQKYIVGNGGAIFDSINKEQIEKIHILIPQSIEEEQKIADCLSSIDELITAESKKLDALKIYKKGLMQQLFPAEGETLPKLRFPAFKDSGSWTKTRVIDLTNSEVKWSFTGGPFGSNLKSSDYTNSGIRVIQLQNIGDGEFIDNYKIYTSENKANELLSCNIYPNEIILSKMGDPVARACLIPDKEKRYLMCSDGIRLAVDKNKFDNYFIYSFINSETFRSIAEKSSTGSTRKRIGLDILKNLKIMIPPIIEQQKIADLLSSLDDSITNQSKKMEALKQHKKGLMQKLFPIMSELQE